MQRTADASAVLCCLFIDVSRHRFVRDSGKCFKNGFKYNLGTLTRDSHTDLLSHAFLIALKDIAIRESLESCSFSIR